MNRVRIVSLIAATLAVAVGAGTLFQQETTRQAAEAPAATENSLVGLAATGSGTRSVAAPLATASVLPSIINTADPLADQARTAGALVVDDRLARAAEVMETATSQSDMAAAETATAEVVNVASDPVLIEDLLAEVDACTVWLVVTPESGAMMDMSLFAPCDGDAVVQISHGGLSFDAQIGGDGQLALSVPAFSRDAELTVRFDDGRSASDVTEVAEAVLHDRFAISWQGPAELGLNAYEFGADFGGEGHVHPGNPAAPDLAAGGFLTALGVDAQVQVYSFPAGLPARAGQVELELETAITDASCAQQLTIQTLEVLAGSEPVQRQLQLEMPECDGQGGFLVLKNLLPEQSIALN
ncbi:MAG: hypothetical protein JJU15_14805 [Pararhodobacter sp.]|nr:hypothetical protein [Pararhodobacter sp.]